MRPRFLIVMALLVVTHPVHARDTVEDYSISEALASGQAQSLLGDQVAFYFGNQAPGNVSEDLGEVRTNRKTNAFNKSDKEACQWVFLSALIALRDRAIEMGGHSVVEIKSNYKNNLTVSDTTFRCGAGALVAGVALTGRIAK